MKAFAIFLGIWASAATAGETPWMAYLAMPTSENASRVQAIDYDPPLVGGYDATDLQILQNQILAEDPEAFRLGYRLYKNADGGLAEDLGVILARSIRAHPSFFLFQVRQLGSTCSAFHWVLNTPGLEYSDRPAAMKYEIVQRQRALSAVKDKQLVATRTACLKEIESP